MPELTEEHIEEHSRVTAGQRRINIIWELTQSIIALAVVLTFLYTCAFIALHNDMEKTAFIVLSDVVSLVIGFYFGRTNHQKTGGIGPYNEIGR